MIDQLRQQVASILEANSAGLVKSRESQTLEFKENFNWANKSEYAKEIVALANNRGGFLIWGVKDRPRKITGLTGDAFENRDPEKISEYLKSCFSVAIDFESEAIEVEGKKLGWLYVYQAHRKPVICIKNDGEIRDGEIYYRNGARSEKISSTDLLRLIEEQQEVERQKWRETLERIARIGVENAAILNLESGELAGSGGRVMIDESLLPKLKFIKEGHFVENEGAPALRLIGDIQGAQIVEQQVDKYRDWLFTKPLGVQLGFPEKNAIHNVRALIFHYQLISEEYMHEGKNASGQPEKQYSPKTLAFLLEKKSTDEFSADPTSDVMKAMRKAELASRRK